MKRTVLLSILTIQVMIFSCSENPKNIFHKNENIPSPFIFNLQHYFTEDELNVSFPLWFNDSLIKLNNIKQFNRYTYYSSKEEDTDSIIRKKNSYDFNKEGELIRMKVEKYYDGVCIGGGEFKFLKGKDENGYSKVKIVNKDKFNADSNFEIFAVENYSDRFLVYINERNGNFLFYLKNRENWGPLSVDSMLNPTPEDIIVFGSPLYPTKKYQVENTVNEFNVVEYEYSKKDKLVTRIKRENYPFNQNRYISYNKKGMCTGFIDSIYSNTKFLASRASQFEYKDGLPEMLIHESHSGSENGNSFQVERFEYVFFESNKH